MWSDERFVEKALDTIHDVFFVLDTEGRLVQWNDRFEEVTGCSTGELDGIDPWHLLGGIDRNELETAIERAWQGRGVLEAGLLVRGGDAVPYEFNAAPLFADDGSPLGIVGIGRDLRERKQMERALQVSEQRWRSLVEAHPEPILLIQDGDIVYANPALCELLGAADQRAVLGRPAARFIAEADREQLAERVGAVMRGVSQFGLAEYRLDTLDGRNPIVETRGVPVTYRGRPAVQALLRDVTELRAAQQELRRHADRMQHLSRRLVTIQEDERRRLASELHDEVGQELTALKLGLEAVEPEVAGRVLEVLRESRQLIQHLQRRVRHLTLDLRPPMLDDLGLVPTLEWHCERYVRRTGIDVRYRLEPLPVLPTPLATTAYRIVQEALTNVARHAKVDVAAASLLREGGQLVVVVEDEGVGFDLDGVSTNESAGLSGMRERAELVGGHFEVATEPGHGTRICARLPLEPNLVQE